MAVVETVVVKLDFEEIHFFYSWRRNVGAADSGGAILEDKAGFKK